MAGRRRILVAGCGAMGSIVAANLADAAEVTGFDANVAHVDAINKQGLRVSGLTKRTVRFTVTADAASLADRAFDAIVFLVKSGATAAVLAALRPALSERTLLVTLQNGMGASEALSAMPDVPIARGVMMDACRYVDPGQVEHLIRGGKTFLGPVRGTVDDVRWFAELLTEAGMPTEVIADPMGAVWAKFVFNSVMNPVGALLLGVNAARYEPQEVRELIDDMAAECMRVVEALGGKFAFDPMEYVKKVRSGVAPMSSHAGSMALDIARGAPTEIDELTGYVVAQGRRLGIPVPACETVYRLVRGLEFAASARNKQAS